MNRSGFSLIELLIYIGILAVISVLFIGILTTSTRVQVHEIALAEVGNQANFVLQTIQRLVRESSLVEEVGQDNPGTPNVFEGDNNDTQEIEISYMKLRMEDFAKDPTCISLLSDGIVYVMQGTGSTLDSCKSNVSISSLITNKVTVPTDTDPVGLTFTIAANDPARNVVDVQLTMSYLNPPPGGNYSKILQTAVGRVSAATFDSDLLSPAGLPTPHNIGAPNNPWDNLFVNNINVSGNISQSGNFNGTNRGYMIVGAQTDMNQTCSAICSQHGLTCTTGYNFAQCGADCSGAAVNDFLLRNILCTTPIVPPAPGAFCICN
ncbi:MAG: prepilin-type N-terminal cleavage/methylation domain-containing protein [Patescibacteria group bacterium]